MKKNEEKVINNGVDINAMNEQFGNGSPQFGNGSAQLEKKSSKAGNGNSLETRTAAEPVLAETALPLKKPIGIDEIKEAYATLEVYRSESRALRQRIIEDELYYEFTCTSGRARNSKDCQGFKKSVSAYLFNSIANKHADFMDNMPSPTILPQEESDQETAKILSDILPSIFDENRYQRKYSKGCYDKLVGGAALYAVTWDGAADNGLGKIRISNAEILNLYWKGGISELEQSPNLFYVSVESNKELKMRYPELADSVGTGLALDLDKFIYEDEPHRDDMTLVVDWYYRRPTVMINSTGARVLKNVLHYCKFAEGKVLFASENEVNANGAPLYPNGYYEHGRYPYLMDTLFPIKGSPAGFGYVDVMKNPQEYIDSLDSSVLEYAEWCAEPHYFVPIGAGINPDDIRDKKKFIEVSALSDQIKQMEVQSIDGNVLNVRNLKIEELKETSGNTDFAQGSTGSGVTAASAIAALQEAGSKLSRDMIKNTYEVYADMCTLAIELMRQFYTTARVYRITMPNSEYAFESISSQDLGGVPEAKTMFGEAIGGRKPYFDIKVDAQKSSPFSRAAQNELALNLYGSGFFNPALGDQAMAALDMMQFESKDAVQAKIADNQQLYAENQQLKSQMIQLAQLLAQAGDSTTAQLADALVAKFGMQDQTAMPTGVSGQQRDVNSLGSVNATDSIAERAKKKAQERSEVK